MCVSDWRVARLVNARVIQAVVSPATNYSLPPNPLRVGVSIAVTPSTGNAQIQVLSQNITVALSEVFTPYLFFHFTCMEYGNLPQMQWNVIGDGLGTNITIIEYTLPADAILIDPRLLVAK